MYIGNKIEVFLFQTKHIFDRSNSLFKRMLNYLRLKHIHVIIKNPVLLE